MGWFTKKESSKFDNEYDIKLRGVLNEYIKELRKTEESDKEITKRLKAKGFEKDVIKNALAYYDDKEDLDKSEDTISISEVSKTLELGRKHLAKYNDMNNTFDLMIKRIHKYSKL